MKEIKGRSSAALGDLLDVRPGAIAGARQQRHALASHLPRHFAQFFRAFVMNRGELLQSCRGTEFGYSLECELACVPTGVQDVVSGDLENVFALDDKGDEILFRRGNLGRGSTYELPSEFGILEGQ